MSFSTRSEEFANLFKRDAVVVVRDDYDGDAARVAIVYLFINTTHSGDTAQF